MDLKPFDVDALSSFFPEHAAEKVDAEVELTTERRLCRVSRKRQLLHLMHVANAAKELQRLPDEEESIHVIMRGNFNGWDLVPAVLRLAAPATIDSLYVATLGFNGANASELLELLDAGTIGSVTFLCSCYFQGSNTQEFERLSVELAKRGHWIKAARSHAKLLVIRLTDGRCIVVESSANLRSCRNIEQFAMTQSPALYEFHRQWMEDVFAHERTQAQADGAKEDRRQPRKEAAQPTRAKAAGGSARGAKPPRRRSKARVVPRRRRAHADAHAH